MNTFKILKKHRMAALLGAAVVGVPLVALPIASTTVLAAAGTMSDTSQDKAPVDAKVTTPMSTNSLAPIVSADKPAVVTIISHMDGSDDEQTAARGHGQGRSGRNMPQTPFDEFFRQFFGENGPGGNMGPGGTPFEQRPQRGAEALGSGFIIGSDGTIVTNNHVIDGGRDIKVILDDGTELSAKVVGHDKKSDLAVLKVSAGHDLPTVSWGDSDELKLGDQVLAIGNPFGIGTTVTAGIVSARGRDLHGGPYDNFIQVDAPINTGNSGGPLVAMNGQVVGINSAIYSPNGGNVGVGFAIPSDEAKDIVAKLIKNGSIEHGYLGVEIQPVTKDIQNALGLDTESGALVASVSNGSPADKAGVKAGDIITSINGTQVADARTLARTVADLTPGTKADAKILRHGDTQTVTITLGDMNNAKQMASNDDGSDSGNGSSEATHALGMSLSSLTDETRQQMDLPDDQSGVLVEDVDNNSAAADDGVQPGDVIVSVNQKPVKSPADIESAAKQAASAGRKQLLLLVSRGDSTSFVALPVTEDSSSNG